MSRGRKEKKLTPKQAVFVQEYLVDFNATRAAIKAGYSKKTAYTIGFENLKKPEIAEAIAKAQAKLAEKTEITQERVVADIVRIGNKAEDHQKFGDALKSRELLAKHLGMFVERVQHGFDERTLATILSALPPEYAEKVKQALIAVVTTNNPMQQG